MMISFSSDPLFYLRFPREDADALLASGIESVFIVEAGGRVDWEAMKDWWASSPDWVFGWIGYDARKSIEVFDSPTEEKGSMPIVLLVKPKHVARIRKGSYVMEKGSWNMEWSHWLEVDSEENEDSNNQVVEWQEGVSRAEYLHHARNLAEQIQLGNIYEANYCIDFYAEAKLFDTEAIWKKLYRKTAAPFAGYASCGQWQLMCASPERYLQRAGNKVISQPIKGTARRSVLAEEDEKLKQQLFLSKKERAENVMIVDLVRNDLSRCALTGTVKVEELFGVHSFRTVHHLISTISCEVDSACSWVDLIRATFPMGSMTGAPKLSAMQWIENHERTSRGIYSGALGYIEPSGDFDFNVVIRSIQYNAERQLLQCNVGGAITALCDLEEEYNECLLKASAVLDVLR